MKARKDRPKINSQEIPVLFYADDAVLIARTTNCFQSLLDAYNNVMGNLGLKTNRTKSFIMKCGLKNYQTSESSYLVVKK